MAESSIRSRGKESIATRDTYAAWPILLQDLRC
ncbi:hypothetical protein FOVG_14787 [Fusarium oxysporum f. sp. pisi HDV247]|uniref:Uncharacterized protein n=1 Tax=Fusarium oxysporum f. sp. pisi HDV247 TaxID=1080344 RepID=W9NT88_FUSOX|nr:hypothetical protein FOVG_14787 [Fusarium oxysporum f. sp. pisi HDV247]